MELTSSTSSCKLSCCLVTADACRLYHLDRAAKAVSSVHCTCAPSVLCSSALLSSSVTGVEVEAGLERMGWEMARSLTFLSIATSALSWFSSSGLLAVPTVMNFESSNLLPSLLEVVPIFSIYRRWLAVCRPATHGKGRESNQTTEIE